MLSVSIRGAAVIVTLMVTLMTQLLMPTEFLLEQQRLRATTPSQSMTTASNTSATSNSISHGKFFHVELIPNPPGQPYFETSHLEEYRCASGDIDARNPFPPEFQSMLQSAYTPKISTNMNMIVMGDSLGIQLATLFQGVAATHALDSSNRAVLGNYPKANGERDMYSVSRARGNGSIAEWRLFGMLRQEGLSQPLPPSAGGGWRHDMVDNMKRITRNMADTTHGQTFDVLLFRIPQVWIPLEDVHGESLLETVLLAAELFQLKTVILVNLPLVKEYTDTVELADANHRIRSFVNLWQQRRVSLPINVLLLELGTLVTQAGEYNAQQLGFDTTETDYVAEQIPNDPLLYTRPVATNCLERPQLNDETGTYTEVCPLNMLFFDGLHLCMETFGPRIVAGTGCLMQCSAKEHALHSDCEQACNEKYMRLNTVSIR